MAKFTYPKIAPSEIEATPAEFGLGEFGTSAHSRRAALAALAAGAGAALLTPGALAQPSAVNTRSAAASPPPVGTDPARLQAAIEKLMGDLEA